MAISFIIAAHNSGANVSLLNNSPATNTLSGDTVVGTSDQPNSGITSWSSSPAVGTWSLVKDDATRASLFGVASTSAQTSPVHTVNFSGSVVAASSCVAHYRGAVGGFGNTGVNNGTVTPATVVINKQSASNWIVMGGDTTAAGATVWSAGSGTTLRDSGSGSGTVTTSAFLDDNGAAATGNQTLTGNISVNFAWSAQGVELLVVASVGGPTRRMRMGVGR